MSERTLQCLRKQFVAFLVEANNRTTFGHSQWLQTASVQIYVRKSARCVDGENRVWTLDISNVAIVEHKRGQGIFTTFLEMVTRLQPWDGIFIENVLDEGFERYFLKRGYYRVNEESTTDVLLYQPKK